MTGNPNDCPPGISLWDWQQGFLEDLGLLRWAEDFDLMVAMVITLDDEIERARVRVAIWQERRLAALLARVVFEEGA